MKVRNSARGIILNNNGQILLFKFYFNKIIGDKSLWVVPGGGLEENESFEDALEREIKEETGIKIKGVPKWVWTREKFFNGKDGSFISYERYYLLDANDYELTLLNMTLSEKNTFIDYKWWKVNEIINSTEDFGPSNIALLVKDLLNGIVPEIPIDIE